MSANPTYLGRVQVAPQGTFGTAATTGFFDLEPEPVAVPTKRRTFEMGTLTGRNYDRKNIVGRQTPELSIPVPNVLGLNASVPSADAVAHGEAEILKSLMGAYLSPSEYGAGVISSSSTTTSIKVDSGTTIANYRAGQIICVSDAGTPTQYAACRITAVTDGGGGDHTLAVTPALPFTPASGASIWSSITVYEDTTAMPYLTFIVQSLDQYSRTEVEGCVCSEAVYTIEPGSQVSGSYKIMGHQATTDNAALSDWAASYPRIPPAMGGNGGRALLGGTAVDFNSLTVTITSDPKERGNVNGAQGLDGFYPTRRRCEVEINRYVAGAAPVFDLPAATSLWIQFGTTPGNMFVIHVPVMDLTEPGDVVETDGLWSQNSTYRANRYAGDTAGGSASANAAFSVGWC